MTSKKIVEVIDIGEASNENNNTPMSMSNESIDQIKRYLDGNSTVVDENVQENDAGGVKMPFVFGDTRTRLRLTVPPPVQNATYNEIRQSLPIHDYRDEILDVIRNHQVCVISGETGSGKTTQVPQYILEDSTAHNNECRIICTQPRRLAATSIAARVTEERKEGLGNTVGYQIRLDSRVKATTNLIFTTSGYLLRCLTGSKNKDVYKNVTHLILDEVHEREKVTDFLLIVIRDILKEHPHLKVILMSATIDSDMFSEYFHKCPMINIPGRAYNVEVYHLAEILMMINYKTSGMAKYMQRHGNVVGMADGPPKETEPKSESNEDMEFLDKCLNECADNKTSPFFEQIFYLISEGNMPVDYKHSQTGRTALSIAAECGLLLTTKRLLFQGAKPNLPDLNGKTPFDYAIDNGFIDCLGSMQRFMGFEIVSESMTKNESLQDLTLTAYISSLNSKHRTEIDHELLFQLISNLHCRTPLIESILVFLPGIDDIIMQKETIEMDMRNSNYELFILHSGAASDQNGVFEQMSPFIRKIILSTNIAETSITINDVVHVIDVGKVKQQTYDATLGSTCLLSTSISKACAKQRMGRAGRIQNGFCYRLYSSNDYEEMQMYTEAEILRVPLSEICLKVRLLANDDVSIEQFLSKALQPPSTCNIRQAINLLQQIDALDSNERITHLGIHLANMPVDCQLGKSIMYAVLMKCLDPVITIASAQSVRDPFLLQVDNDSPSIADIRAEFSESSLSDHYMLYNTFNQWHANESKGREFCRNKMIRESNMQMIAGIRKLIRSHLQMTGVVREDSKWQNSRYLNENSHRWDIIKACLTAGSYPNICRVEPSTGNLVSKYKEILHPHRSSVLCIRGNRNHIDERVLELQIDWFIHGEKSKAGRAQIIRSLTPVPSIDLVLFAGSIVLSEAHAIEDNSSGETVVKIDDWVCLSMRTMEAQMLLQLRQKFSMILAELLKNPKSFSIDQRKESVLDLIYSVIQREDSIERSINEIKATQSRNHQLIIQLNDAANIKTGPVRINSNASFKKVVNKGMKNEIEIISDGTGRILLNDVDATYMVSISINDGINSKLVANIRIDGTKKSIQFNEDLFLLKNESGLIDRRLNQNTEPSLIMSLELHIELMHESKKSINVHSTYGRYTPFELNFDEDGLQIKVNSST